MDKIEKKVRIRILPLHGIGGIGNAGVTAWMTKEDADRWVAEGYVEIIPDADEPVISTAKPADAVEARDQPLAVTELEPAAEASHEIMKPRSKRK